MTGSDYTVSKIASICRGTIHPIGYDDKIIYDLLIDSRRLIHHEHCLFVALVSERNDGHKFIEELYEKGVRCFMVSEIPKEFTNAIFILVKDTLAALQQLGAFHRSLFDIPVIGITGSNGKTIVKEWLFQLLNSDFRIIRSPKSYNSQIGVPLSVWKMKPEHELAIFEAGISLPGEMERLEPVISPTIGIFTNIGHAHDEHFENHRQKVKEKLRLFKNSEILIYSLDYPLITECLKTDAEYKKLKTFTWSRNTGADLLISSIEKDNKQTRIMACFRSENIEIIIPFTDKASIENSIHCLALEIALNKRSLVALSTSGYASLVPIAMRLELKEAVNHCSLINDSYNSDINSLGIALDFLNQQNPQQKRTIILSDILQTGRNKEDLYQEISLMLVSRNINRVIGIGRDMLKYARIFPMQKAFFSTTDEFMLHFPISSFQNEVILLKGARIFEFEKISQLLQLKAHETVMEVNLDALIHNLNYFRSGLQQGTKTMAMVKAFSYGAGSYEIANVLQYHRVDYLSVAYADEGVELRKAGIHLPVMVMSPEEQSLDTLLKYNLEPEIYNLHIFNLLEEAIARNQTSIQQQVRVHIKLDTGMHRLGFVESELETFTIRLKQNPDIRVQSVFSHLAASDNPREDDFTRGQIRQFISMSDRIISVLDYPVLRHILNSAGIQRFPEAQFDMVRLGIGLYGIGNSSEEQSMLRNVSTLKSVITQIKHIRAGETIGYDRKGKAEKDTVIAIVPLGYADGLNRRLGNGRGRLYINGKPAPIIGNICMDLTIIDIGEFMQDETNIEYRLAGEDENNRSTGHPKFEFQITEGTEVIIFGDKHPVSELAEAIGTIPYEALTGISRRVKRIYYYE
ncbi:MAG: bifunctional UDP-N-acetylmuramoyl-tripeptide:D-alanyl-D-alanine ligase/alanine racemase [Bacteroidota bacterium]